MAASLPPARAQMLGYGVRVPQVTWRGLDHVRHSYQLRRAVALGTNAASGDLPTVVFTGDSTMLQTGNDSFNEFETACGAIMRRLREENPGTTFRFLNRAVGGSTWNHLANVAAGNYPSWYSLTSAQWINSYISPTGNGGTNKAPDLVVIQSGTNDNAAANFADIAAVLAKFTNASLFPVLPDIWLCTSCGRTRDTSRSTAAQIAGSLVAQSVNRTVARAGAAAIGSTFSRPFGLLDFGRMDAMARLGIDPGYQPLQGVSVSAYQGVSALGTTGWTLPSCDGDFDYQVTFPGQSATLWAGPRAMRLGVGAGLNSGSSVALLLVQRSGTTVTTQLQPGAGTINGTSATVADGIDVVIRVIAKQHHLFISINGTTVWDAVAARGVAPFSPRIWFGSDGANDLSLRLDYMRCGRSVPVAPTVTELEAWGENTTGINGTTGGNMVNHPSALHFHEVMRPVLDAESFYLG